MKNYILVLLLLATVVTSYAQTTLSSGIATTPASTNLNLRTNSSATNRLTILNSGNTGFVGIGANLTPLELLHVDGSIRGARINSTNGTFSSVGANNLTFYTNAGASGTGGSLWATILNSNGYMGINTASGSIAERLHVTGNIRTSGNFISDAGIFNANHASNPLVFQTNGTERVRIVNSGTYAGNVGIGTNSPITKLQVDISNASTSYGSGISLTLTNTNTTLNNFNVLGFRSGYGSNVAYIGTQITDHYEGYGKLFFSTAGNLTNVGPIQRMVIEENGNVGVGSLAPASKLQVDIASANTTYASATSSDVSLTLKNTNSTNNNLNILNFADANGSAATQIGTTTSDHTNHYGKLFFSTRGTGGLTQKMTIDEYGHVRMGSLSSGYIYLMVGGTAMAKRFYIESTIPAISTGEESSTYLNIFNFEDEPNGLNAKGVLVSDDYAYATPTAGNLVVKGAVGIGTPFTSNPNAYKLAVNGKIGAKDLQIETSSTTWPDYVFEESYKLPALGSVEKYVRENKHLEGMPSAEEVKEKGYSVHELNEALLKKVEELTLYVIDQQKQIDELKKEVSGKKKRKN